MCTAKWIGHRDLIESCCFLCGDAGHSDRACGVEHHRFLLYTRALQSDASSGSLTAASAVCWWHQEGERHLCWCRESSDVKMDRDWITVEIHRTDIFISMRGTWISHRSRNLNHQNIIEAGHFSFMQSIHAKKKKKKKEREKKKRLQPSTTQNRTKECKFALNKHPSYTHTYTQTHCTRAHMHWTHTHTHTHTHRAHKRAHAYDGTPQPTP